MTPKLKTTVAAIAVATTLGVGGAVTIDRTQLAIPVECDMTRVKVTDLHEKFKTYRIDEGFIATRKMTATDRADIKGCEIAKSVTPEKVSRNSTEIEIVSIEPIDGGVQVFARVWKDDEQIGFGDDGTVDIERFRVYNPPILVLDPAGDIVQVIEPNKEFNTPGYEERFREDPKEALLQVIEHNLSVMENIHSSKNIQAGKVGKTTTTVYSQASPASTAMNAMITSGYKSTMQLAHDTVTGDGSQASSPYGNNLFLVRALRNASGYYLNRTMYLFDTSAISSGDTISSAILSLYGNSFAYDNDSGTTVEIVASSPASNTSVVNGDFDNFSYTSFASLAIGSVNQAAYNDFTLDANGRANVTKAGISKFGAIAGLDLNITSMTSGHDNIIAFYEASDTGTTRDPKLVVEHAAAATRRIINIQ